MGITLSQYRAAIGRWSSRMVPNKDSYSEETSGYPYDGNAKRAIGSIIIMSLVCIGILNSVVMDQNLGIYVPYKQAVFASSPVNFRSRAKPRPYDQNRERH